MLDVLSGGRLVAGFPVGTSMDTNFCYGQIPALTRDKYPEAHDLIMRAWAEDEPFAFDGKYNQLRYVNCWPKPIQQPHPPDLHPGRRLDRDVGLLPRPRLQLLLPLLLRLPRAASSCIDGYWDRVAERGKDDSPYRAAFAQIICVADTDAEAEELYAEHVLYFFNRCLHVYPGFADPPGYRTINTIKAGALSQLRQDAQKIFQNLTWKQLVDGGFVIAGSPDTVRAAARGLIKALRVGHRLLPVPHRQHAGLEDALLHQAVRREGHAQAARTSGRTGRTTTAGGQADGRPARPPAAADGHGARRWARSASRTSRQRVTAAMKARRSRPAAASAAACSRPAAGAPLVFFHGAGGLLARQPLPRRPRSAAPRLRPRARRATASPPARSCWRTCSTSRCTAGTWSRRSDSAARTWSATPWAA